MKRGAGLRTWAGLPPQRCENERCNRSFASASNKTDAALRDFPADYLAAEPVPMVVRTSNSSGKKVRSRAFFKKPTPEDPPVPRR